MVDMFRGPEAALQPAVYTVRAADATIGTLLQRCGWDAALPITWGPPGLATTLRAVWTASGLCVRFDVQDRAPWATRTQRDDRLWEQEVVEIFLDPTCAGRDYAELEISPHNVVCDLHIERLAPERLVHLAWDFAHLQTTVHRTPDGDDWCAIAHIPFDDFATLSPRVAECLPVQPGDVWHFNAFRIKRPGGPERPEDGAIYAAWSVPEGPTFHAPLAFRPMVFEPPPVR
jgi:hypothetical protein